MIRGTRTSKLTLIGLHGWYSLATATTRSDQTLRLKHFAYIWETVAVWRTGDRRFTSRIAGRRIPRPGSCYGGFVLGCVLSVRLAVNGYFIYVWTLGGLLIVVAQMR